MKELSVKKEKSGKSKFGELKVYAFELEPGDNSGKIDEYIDAKYGKGNGITKDEFHSILDKASQPIEHREDNSKGKLNEA